MQDDSAQTVNAAAVVLAAAARSSTGLRHHHHQLDDDDHATATKKRWWSRLTAKLCFRPHGHPRRIADDTSPQPAAHTAAYVHHAPQPVFAFVAPPSSPASSLLGLASSESEAPSPVLLLHASSPSSIFAVGPYAHGPQQLVSPPVLYSTFTTEPSTAPPTPPGATNPSSPEVPFARFLASSSSIAEQHCGGEAGLFHAYQLQPGSPIPLVSPGSSSSSPQLFRVRARNEGSLLDGHIPMASGGTATARSEGGGSARDDDEVPRSGEFVFGNADGGAASAGDMDGEARKNWHFFPMVEVEHGMI